MCRDLKVPSEMISQIESPDLVLKDSFIKENQYNQCNGFGIWQFGNYMVRATQYNTINAMSFGRCLHL